MKNKTIIFYTLLTAFLISFLLKLADFPFYSPMNIILSADSKNITDFIIKTDDNYDYFFKAKNTLNKLINQKIGKIEILIKKNNKDKINEIIVFNDVKAFYFNDFSQFEKSEEKICFKNQCKIYNKYSLNNVKLNKNSKYINQYSPLAYVGKFLIKFIKIDKHFLLCYILLIALILFYINYKKQILIPKTKKIAPCLILLLLVLICMNDINLYVPWGDEIWAIYASSTCASLSQTMSDPGIPPLYYLVLRFFNLIFGFSFLKMHLLSLFLSLFTLFFVYIFSKEFFNRKVGLLASFLLAINVHFIYVAKEIRCYCLFFALTILSIYFVHKILKTNKFKYYFLYFLTSILIVNTHYFGILLTIVNSSYLLFYLIKNNKKIKTFLLSHILVILSFLPFFIHTALNKALLNPDFNNLLSDMNFSAFLACVSAIGGGLINVVATALLLTRIKPLNKVQKQILYHFILVFFSILFFTTILSFTIRPMFAPRYFENLLPLFAIIFAISICYSKLKFAPIIAIILIFLSQNYDEKIELDLRRNNMKEYNLYYISKQISKYENPKNIYIITRPSTMAYQKLHKNIIIEDAKYIPIPTPRGKNKPKIDLVIINKIKEIKNDNKNALIFTTMLPLAKETATNPNNTCFFNPEEDICLWKIK